MERTGIRTYEVSAADFPLEVVIQAKNIPTCSAVVSDVHVVRAGVLVAQNSVEVSDDKASFSKRYTIKRPTQKPSCDLIQTVNGFFGQSAPDDAKYEIAITSSSGDSFKTNIGVPSIDPGVANLTFQFR